MGHFSLNKTSFSKVAKVPGMAILGLLALGFFLFPFAVFAQCGQPDVANADSILDIQGSSCAGRTITNAQASTAAQEWSVGSKGQANASKVTAATLDPAFAELVRISACTFVSVKTGQKVQLHNGAMILATENKNGKTVPLILMVVGGRLVAVTHQGSGMNQNPNVKLVNGVLPQR